MRRREGGRTRGQRASCFDVSHDGGIDKRLELHTRELGEAVRRHEEMAVERLERKERRKERKEGNMKWEGWIEQTATDGNRERDSRTSKVAL
jgi:hypothetical protein